MTNEQVSVDSPSGSILKHTEGGSNWVQPSEFPKVAKALLKSATQNHLDWLGSMNTKYMTVRMDMRTGHFVILDNAGNRVDGDDAVLARFGIKPEVVENARSSSS